MQSSTTSSEPVRVLLVDDNEAILARAAAVLKSCCEVVGAVTDGPAALDAAATLRPDVIVLDISMPGMTGFEVAGTPSSGRLEGGAGFPHRPRRRRIRSGCHSRRRHRIRRQAQARVRSGRRRARSAGGTAVRVGDPLSSAAEHAESGPRTTRNTRNPAADYAEHAESGPRTTRSRRPRCRACLP